MTISYEQAIPMLNEYVSVDVDLSLFGGHESARFWVGIVALNGQVMSQDIYDATLSYRGNRFGRDLGFISLEALDERGRELNEDDKRATVFSVVERVSPNQAVVTGTSRLIHRGDDLLPLERYFPEAATLPLAANTDEISRVAANHRFKLLQQAISGSLTRAMAHNAVDNGVEKTVAQIEEAYYRDSRSRGLNIDVLAEKKWIAEENGSLLAVAIDPYAAVRMGSDSENSQNHESVLHHLFRYDIENKGLGFFDLTFINGEV